MNELEIIKARFIKYSEVFNHLNPGEIPPFFYTPSLLITPTTISPPMFSRWLIILVFNKAMGKLKKQGYSRSILDLQNLSVKIMSSNTAIVSGTATRYKEEGGVESELEKIGFTYTMRKDIRDNTWKIIVGIIHAPETAIAL